MVHTIVDLKINAFAPPRDRVAEVFLDERFRALTTRLEAMVLAGGRNQALTTAANSFKAFAKLVKSLRSLPGLFRKPVGGEAMSRDLETAINPDLATTTTTARGGDSGAKTFPDELPPEEKDRRAPVSSTTILLQHVRCDQRRQRWTSHGFVHE